MFSVKNRLSICHSKANLPQDRYSEETQPEQLGPDISRQLPKSPPALTLIRVTVGQSHFTENGMGVSYRYQELGNEVTPPLPAVERPPSSYIGHHLLTFFCSKGDAMSSRDTLGKLVRLGYEIELIDKLEILGSSWGDWRGDNSTLGEDIHKDLDLSLWNFRPQGVEESSGFNILRNKSKVE
eukprot:sb/3471587/